MSPALIVGTTLVAGLVVFMVGAVAWRLAYQQPLPQAIGAAVLDAGGPGWLGWRGIGLGAAFLAGFAGTRFAGPFNPPFLAHTYTAVHGVWLLTQV